jgi:hypothetical protein
MAIVRRFIDDPHKAQLALAGVRAGFIWRSDHDNPLQDAIFECRGNSTEEYLASCYASDISSNLRFFIEVEVEEGEYGSQG